MCVLLTSATTNGIAVKILLHLGHPVDAAPEMILNATVTVAIGFTGPFH